MIAARIAEIELELQEVMPYSSDYDPNALTVIPCKVCNGAIDDHCNGCHVPLVYELLDEVKRLSEHATHAEVR